VAQFVFIDTVVLCGRQSDEIQVLPFLFNVVAIFVVVFANIDVVFVVAGVVL